MKMLCKCECCQKINKGKIIKVGLAGGLVMFILSMVMGKVIGVLFPSLMAEYANPGLFRPWSDPLMSLYFLYPFVEGLVVAFVWEMVKELCTEKDWVKRGICFGFLFWLLTNITGMLISYSTFPVSFLMIVSWSLSSLVQMLGAGLVNAKMNK